MTMITTTCRSCGLVPATTALTAQYLDPDRDDDGFVIGWSKAITSDLCDDCVADRENDDYVAILEQVTL